MTCKLLIATNNSGKLTEYRALLSGTPCELVSLGDAGIKTMPEETGSTMEENARLKATVIAAQSGMVTLADDSGLEVDALGGEPGVRSARYAGEYASDSDRVRHLLGKLEGVPWERRSATFRCVIAIATPDGKVATTQGECHGTIALQPKGGHGFGYDPVFFIPDVGKTMAELPSEVKDSISHRGRAAAKVPKVLSLPPFECR